MESVWHVSLPILGMRLLLALVLGGLIGWERELSHHSAGFRTHILVCIGSALIMLLSMYGFADFAAEPNVRLDPARLAAQVISGIGFLGAGTILRNGNSVSGLTTAASIWVVAAIGLAVAAGFYVPACLATLLVFISLRLLNRVEKRFIVSKKTQTLLLDARFDPGILARIGALFEELRITVRHIAVTERKEAGGMTLCYTLIGSDKNWLNAAIEKLNVCDGIYNVMLHIAPDSRTSERDKRPLDLSFPGRPEESRGKEGDL